MNHLTTQEIEAIRKRAEQAKVNPFQLGEISVAKRYLYDDIPKLLAEVDRLNAVLDEEISEKEHVIMAQQMEIGRLYSKLNGGD